MNPLSVLRPGYLLNLSLAGISLVVISCSIPCSAFAVGGAFGSDRLDSIETLGNCREFVEVDAQHKNATALSVWISVKETSALSARRGACIIKMREMSAQFYEWSALIDQGSTTEWRRTVSQSSRDDFKIPRRLIYPGARIKLVFKLRVARHESLRSPLSEGASGSACSKVTAAIVSSERAMRRCATDADCAPKAISFGCGCQFDKPINYVADANLFLQLVSSAEKVGCFLNTATICNCESTSDVICRRGLCDWN